MSSRQFFSLFCAVFLLFAGYGLFLNSAGIKLAQMGVSNIAIGALNAAFFGGATISAIVSHRIISRVGHIRSFGVFGALFAIAAMAHMMFDSFWAWGGLRALLGFCYFSLLMVVESWFTERSSADKRAKVLAIYEVVFYVAFTVGIALMSFKFSSNNIFTLAAILVMASMLPVGLTRVAEPTIPPRQKISLPRVLAVAPLATAGSFAAGILINGFFTMASVFILQQGFNVRQISVYLGCAMFGGLISQIPVAYVSNRIGRRTTIMLCSAIPCAMAISALGVMQIQPSFIGIHYITAFIFGSCLFTLYSLSLARANDVKPKLMNAVEINRSLLFVYGLGSLVAPLLLGVVTEHANHFGFYSVYFMVTLALSVFAWLQKPIPPEERSVYVGMPANGGTIIGDLDPRDDTMGNATDAENHTEQAQQPFSGNLEDGLSDKEVNDIDHSVSGSPEHDLPSTIIDQPTDGSDSTDNNNSAQVSPPSKDPA
ncbi:MFS transporter [Snodgrassella sp. CFCC 13594]|uniref:MFS transporter n=1 Tax=Snodgrassella sp. CFCC 13594 TaxID=1775559 RepID=UPI00082CEB12|nr:MFS transporter [Snodgrassella sp. CFCC 13594]